MIINNYNTTIGTQDCLDKKVKFLQNRTDTKNLVMVLKQGCFPIYKTIFALNTINTVCITSICAVQAAMIVFKFFYYFIAEKLPEEAHATMNDKKVVVHSS